MLGGWVVSVCFHEFAHAYAAYRAGDRSVEAAGYLTLNPFKYAHPFLSILLPLFFIVSGGIGLPGGAVYLHPHAFRSKALAQRRRGGRPADQPRASRSCCCCSRSRTWRPDVPGDGDSTPASGARVAFLGFLQVTAAVLNLLPVPGLDGYAIIEPYLDPRDPAVGDKVKPWGMLGVIVLLLYLDPLNNAFFDLVNWICRAHRRRRSSCGRPGASSSGSGPRHPL